MMFAIEFIIILGVAMMGVSALTGSPLVGFVVGTLLAVPLCILTLWIMGPPPGTKVNMPREPFVPWRGRNPDDDELP